MTTADQATRSIVVERFVAHPPEKVWRALTQSWLIEEWLMPNDFEPIPGHRFTVSAMALPGWTGVTNCEVVLVEAPRRLAYRWGDGSESEVGLKTLVTWTLTRRDEGTFLRMEQSGFPQVDRLSYGRLGRTWKHAFTRLEALLATGKVQYAERSI